MLTLLRKHRTLYLKLPNQVLNVKIKINLSNQNNLSPIIKKIVPQTEKLTHRFIEHLKKSNTDTDQLYHLKHIKEYDATSNNLRAMQELDQKLCSVASTLTNNELLQYLTYLMITTPNKILDYEFYGLSRSIITHRIEELTPHQLVHFMYVVSMQKKSYNSKKLMAKCLWYLTNNTENLKLLTLEDLLIVCTSTFKTSCLINNSQLLQILQQNLYENLNIISDPPLFITLVKSLRQNSCQNEELLTTISATIFFNSTFHFYNFAAMCHILALYADYSYYDEALLKLFAELCIKHLRESHIVHKRSYMAENIRPKDIKRFLWSYSYLSYPLTKEYLKVIEDNIFKRFDAGHYENDPESLIDCAFYLYMLEYKSTEMLQDCRGLIDKVRGNKSDTVIKTKIRINMLLVCLQLEDLRMFKEFNCKIQPFMLKEQHIKAQLEKRPELVRVFDILKSYMNELEVNRLEYEFQVPHINIVGITGYNKNIYKAFVVEVLDQSTKVKNVARPTGPMQLKIRLLYKLDVPVILIDSTDFEDLNEEEIREFIKRELSIVT